MHRRITRRSFSEGGYSKDTPSVRSERFIFMTHQKYLTPEGLEKVKQEIEHLKTVRRPKIIDRIARAKELGDLSENAEYASAKEEQSFAEGRIEELESLLHEAEVVEHMKGDAVGLGSTIRVQSEGQEKTFMIVGSNEADPSTGKISHESPLGEAFLGKRVGDAVSIHLPRGVVEYSIEGIE